MQFLVLFLLTTDLATADFIKPFPDPRSAFDRTNNYPEYRSVARIRLDSSQVGIEDIGSAAIVDPCLGLTNRHVVKKIGETVRFLYGQPATTPAAPAHPSDKNNPLTMTSNKEIIPFRYEIPGKVVMIGGSDQDTDENLLGDWALVQFKEPFLDRDQEDPNKKIKPLPLWLNVPDGTPGYTHLHDIVKYCPQLEWVGFPGDLPDAWLWGQRNCKADNPDKDINNISYTLSCIAGPGTSGAPLLCRNQATPEKKYKLKGLPELFIVGLVTLRNTVKSSDDHLVAVNLESDIGHIRGNDPKDRRLFSGRLRNAFDRYSAKIRPQTGADGKTKPQYYCPEVK